MKTGTRMKNKANTSKCITILNFDPKTDLCDVLYEVTGYRDRTHTETLHKHYDFIDDCNHDFTTYTGLVETFDYCKHCNARKV